MKKGFPRVPHHVVTEKEFERYSQHKPKQSDSRRLCAAGELQPGENEPHIRAE